MTPETRGLGPKEKRQGDDVTRRGNGDDALDRSSPTDTRSDEKVIVNEQRENKIVNAPSQTAVNASEGSANDEEIMD